MITFTEFVGISGRQADSATTRRLARFVSDDIVTLSTTQRARCIKSATIYMYDKSLVYIVFIWLR
jgi:hypothetical protein